MRFGMCSEHLPCQVLEHGSGCGRSGCRWPTALSLCRHGTTWLELDSTEPASSRFEVWRLCGPSLRLGTSRNRVLCPPRAEAVGLIVTPLDVAKAKQELFDLRTRALVTLVK